MERVKFLDLDLLIERAGDQYRARVIQSPAGQASAEFVLPFTPQDIEILMLRVGRARRGVRRIESPEMQSAKQFGGKLFDAVFAGDVRGALRSSMDTASREDVGLRVRLRLRDAAELTDLPWEFLYNSSLNRFLALSNKTPLVRYIEIPETPRALKIAPPLRVLVMISSPSDYEPLDSEREWRKLNDALREQIANKLVQLERLDTATLGALRRTLRQDEYHVLHFIGHGGFDEQTQDGVLILEDEQQRGRSTSGQYISTVVTMHDAMRLVVLNACEGGRAARNDPFAGVAQSLVQQGIPAVIAMQFEITDEASIAFAREFYAALADGYPVDAALGEARGAIFSEVNDLEWGTPVLYLRAPDGIIFEPLAEEERVARAAELRERERQTQIETLTRDAQNSFAQDDLDAAEKALTALVALDAQNETARDLQSKLQAARARHTKETSARIARPAPPVTSPERAVARPAPPATNPERAEARPSSSAPNPKRAPAPTAPRQITKGGFPQEYILPLVAIAILMLLGVVGAFILVGWGSGRETPTAMARNTVIPTQPIAVSSQLPTQAALALANTPAPLVATAVPPTRTSLPPTETVVPPTATAAPPTPLPQAGAVQQRGADHAPMVFVPAGEFLMGSADQQVTEASKLCADCVFTDEKPQHTVFLNAFWIDQHEVTNAQYKECVDAGKCQSPGTGSYTRDVYYANSQFDNYPVILVSWGDAESYCVWADKRLPTEAEWEKAARGTDGRIYPWGNQAPTSDLLNFADKNTNFGWSNKNIDDKYADTSPVGNYPNGASPYGAYDMAGNVWEWVNDWYDENYYASSPKQNPQGATAGPFRVLRGGSWSDRRTEVRTATRLDKLPNYRDDNLGFRCSQ